LVQLRIALRRRARDYRFESGEQPCADRVVAVSLVLAMPKRMQNFRQILSMNVKRWGFYRKAHGKDLLTPLTIDQYMDGGIGDLVRGRVRDLLATAVDKFEKRKEERERVQKAKLAAFRQKQRQRCQPVLKRILKSLWDCTGNGLRKKLAEEGKRFRDDPVPRRRRITRNVAFEEIEDYTSEGEVIWEKKEARRRAAQAK
jgi:hypothetical protein